MNTGRIIEHHHKKKRYYIGLNPSIPETIHSAIIQLCTIKKGNNEDTKDVELCLLHKHTRAVINFNFRKRLQDLRVSKLNFVISKTRAEIKLLVNALAIFLIHRNPAPYIFFDYQPTDIVQLHAVREGSMMPNHDRIKSCIEDYSVPVSHAAQQPT